MTKQTQMMMQPKPSNAILAESKLMHRQSFFSTVSENRSQQEEIANLKRQLAEFQHVIDVNASANESMALEIKQLRSENDELLNDVQEIMHEVSAIENELEAVKNREASLLSQCGDVVRERDQLADEVESQRENIIVLRQSNAQVRRKMSHSKKSMHALNEKVLDLTRQRDQLNQIVDSLAMEKRAMRKQMEQLIQHLRGRPEKLGALNGRATDLNKTLKQWKSERPSPSGHKLLVEKNSMKNTLEQLIQEMQDLNVSTDALSNKKTESIKHSRRWKSQQHVHDGSGATMRGSTGNSMKCGETPPTFAGLRSSMLAIIDGHHSKRLLSPYADHSNSCGNTSQQRLRSEETIAADRPSMAIVSSVQSLFRSSSDSSSLSSEVVTPKTRASSAGNYLDARQITTCARTA